MQLLPPLEAWPFTQIFYGWWYPFLRNWYYYSRHRLAPTLCAASPVGHSFKQKKTINLIFSYLSFYESSLLNHFLQRMVIVMIGVWNTYDDHIFMFSFLHHACLFEFLGLGWRWACSPYLGWLKFLRFWFWFWGRWDRWWGQDRESCFSPSWWEGKCTWHSRRLSNQRLTLFFVKFEGCAYDASIVVHDEDAFYWSLDAINRLLYVLSHSISYIIFKYHSKASRGAIFYLFGRIGGRGDMKFFCRESKEEWRTLVWF